MLLPVGPPCSSVSEDTQIFYLISTDQALSPFPAACKREGGFFRPADILCVLSIYSFSSPRTPGETGKKQQISLVDQALQAKTKVRKGGMELYSPRPVLALQRGVCHFILLILIYLAAPALGCGMWELFSCGMHTLSCSMWHLVP